MEAFGLPPQRAGEPSVFRPPARRPSEPPWRPLVRPVLRGSARSEGRLALLHPPAPLRGSFMTYEGPPADFGRSWAAALLGERVEKTARNAVLMAELRDREHESHALSPTEV